MSFKQSCSIDTTLNGFTQDSAVVGTLESLDLCGSTIPPELTVKVPDANAKKEVAAIVRQIDWTGESHQPIELWIAVNADGRSALDALMLKPQSELKSTFKLGMWMRDPSKKGTGETTVYIQPTNAKGKMSVDSNRKLSLWYQGDLKVTGTLTLYCYGLKIGPDPKEQTIFQYCTGGTNQGTAPWGGVG
jgi:hypothetical protein